MLLATLLALGRDLCSPLLSGHWLQPAPDISDLQVSHCRLSARYSSEPSIQAQCLQQHKLIPSITPYAS